MFISYGANSTSKAPRPTYSSSGTSSTVSQKRPQTEHCYRQHRANCSRHAVQQQQRNGHQRTCSFWPLPASDVQHYVSQNDDYQPSSSRWWDIPAHVHLGTCAPASPFFNVCAAGLAASRGPSTPEWCDRSVVYQSPDGQQAAAFWTDCNRFSCWPATPNNSELQ